MGTKLFDQYSLIHFAVGVIVYFYRVPFLIWLLLHSLFEIVENSETGMYVIGNYIKIWPRGKPRADAFINSIGDTISAVLGWMTAKLLDDYAK